MILFETNIRYKLIYLIVFLIVLTSSIILLQKFTESIIILICLILFFVFILYFYFNKGLEFKEVIIYLSVSPLVYLGIYFHYLIFYVILQDILLLALFIYSFFVNTNVVENRITKLEKVILLFFLYTTLMFIFGLFTHSKYFAFEEFYHLLYYAFTIPIALIFTKEQYYHRIFQYVIFIYIIISIEYIIANIVLASGRFVTFQAYFLPVIISIIFSIILFVKKNRISKLNLVLIFLLFILALIFTKTRTVWISTLIPMSLIFITYLYKERNWGLKGISSLTILGMGLIVIFLLSTKSAQQTEKNTNDIEYRTSSISNPTEDKAFLMRVELGYYTYLKFLESPIWGHGMGDYVKYKFLGIVDKPVYFPDNSWFYFLWKGGIIGFTLFFIVFFYSIKTALYIYKESKNDFKKAIALGIAAGLLGMIILGLLNAILIKYKTTILFPIIFAYLVVEKKRIEKEKVESHE